MTALLFLLTPFTCGMAFVGLCAVTYVARIDWLRRQSANRFMKPWSDREPGEIR